MSTDTASTDRTANPPWLASLGKYFFVGCFALASFGLLSAWNAADVLIDLYDGSPITWQLHDLGFRPFSFVWNFSFQYILAVTGTAAFAAIVAEQTGYSRRWQMPLWYGTGAALLTPVAFFLSSFPADSLVMAGVYAAIGLLLVAPAAGIGTWVTEKIIHRPRSGLIVAAIAGVLFVAIATPVAIGAVVDEPAEASASSDFDESYEGIEAENESDEDFEEISVGEECEEDPTTESVALEPVAADTDLDSAEAIGYEPARTADLQGDIKLKCRFGFEEALIENATLAEAPVSEANVVEKVAVWGSGSGNSSVSFLYSGFFDNTADYGFDSANKSEAVVAVDVVEDGEVVRYQAQVDLEGLRED